ncbi:MAG: AI-2E family transporter [Verrucomicrobiales bacterium]
MASVVVIMAGLKAAAALFIPVMLGLFFALLSLPILNWLDRRAFPRPLAVLATVLIDLLIMGGIVFLASGVIGEFTDRSGVYAEKLRAQASEFSETMDRQLEKLGSFWTEMGDEDSDSPKAGDPELNQSTPEAEPEAAVDAPDDSVTVEAPGEGERLKVVASGEGSEVTVVPSENEDGVAAADAGDEDGLESPVPSFNALFMRYWDTNRIVGFLGQVDVLSRFTSIASQSFFVLIVMIFVLAESGLYAQKVRAVLQVRGPDLSRFESTSRDIQKYLGIKTGVSFATGILAMATCMVFRVDFPILWGLVAFVFNYVPAIGSIVAAIPPVILALILHGFWPSMGVLGCYLLINIVIGNFLEPTLLGDRFGLSTVIVILSVLFWGFIWGPVGMLLAVPLTMVVKVMLDNSNEFRWISAFMGKGTAESRPDEEKETEVGGATESPSAG